MRTENQGRREAPLIRILSFVSAPLFYIEFHCPSLSIGVSGRDDIDAFG